MMMQDQSPTGKGKGYLALLTTSLVWGTTWVASKVGVKEIPALQMAYIRQFLAGLLFVGFFLFYKKLPLPSRKQFKWITVMAILMFVFANGLSTWSLKYIPTGLAALIGALYPLSVVIIEWLFFKSQRIGGLTFLGLLLGIAGIGIVFYENVFHHLDIGYFIGLGLSLVAMLGWSLGTVFLSRNKANMNPYFGTGWQMLISSVILFIFAETTQPTVAITAISLKVWAMIFYLVIFGSVISFVAFIYSMKKLPPAVSSLYAYINPLVAMLVAALVLKEKLTLNILWGSLVTLVGVFLVNYSIKKNKPTPLVEAEI
jgi:drug/metabolite transporter (DMT)-like permease